MPLGFSGQCLSELSHGTPPSGPKACSEFEFRQHKDLDDHLAARHSGLVSSQMCEDAFKFQKNSKVIRGKKKFRRPEKSYGVALARRVLSGVHKYQELPVVDALKVQRVRLPRTARRTRPRRRSSSGRS